MTGEKVYQNISYLLVKLRVLNCILQRLKLIIFTTICINFIIILIFTFVLLHQRVFTKCIRGFVSGKPVISSKVGGCEEIISNGINGFLVEREVKSFKEKIKYFTNNKEEINRMGESARKLILENWSWSKRSKDWYNFILNSLNA